MDYLNYVNGLSQLYLWTISTLLMDYLFSINVLSQLTLLMYYLN